VVKSLDATPPPKVDGDAKANILIVDDRRSNLMALEAVLEPLNENVVLATSGREALRHILKAEFAVILMDVQMPDMDGLETAALIRERSNSRYIPIIFITAINTDEQFVYQGYSVGAVDYITKPFNSSMLVSKVSVFVELHKKEKQLKEQTRRLHEAELESMRLKQREREIEFEQEKIRAVNRLLEERVQERTAELEAFCYSVSHDLRAPLRSMHGYSSTLERDYADTFPEEVRASLERIRVAAKKMDELISALLSLSRITRSELRLSVVDLSHLSRSIIEEFQSTEGERTVELDIHDMMLANGDPALLRSLLFNLISNAWKFTAKREDARVEVGSFIDANGQTVFFVKDNGVGFNPKYSHKLFQPFERLHGADTYPGNGIGLATVLRIVRKHGGNVWAEGDVDKGAQFYFTL
jgi:two-component system, sensor histidine kinase and response regulator